MLRAFLFSHRRRPVARMLASLGSPAVVPNRRSDVVLLLEGLLGALLNLLGRLRPVSPEDGLDPGELRISVVHGVLAPTLSRIHFLTFRNGASLARQSPSGLALAGEELDDESEYI